MKVNPSLAVMNRFGWMLLACGLVVIVGCQPKKTELAPTSVPTGNSQANNDPKTEEEKKIEDMKAEIEKRMKGNPQAHIINPQSWPTVPADKPIAKRGIGEIIDDGIENLDPTLVNVKLECLNRGDVLSMSPTLKIKDDRNFVIEYALPETEATMNSIAADGQERAYYEGQKVKELAPFGKSEIRKKMNKAEIKEFIERMPVEGFRYFSHGDRPWSAFIAGLADPKNGFKVSLEEKNLEAVGDKRAFYRYVAKSTGKEPTEIEIIVDSKRNVPVTFRANQKFADGKERKLVWSAQWNFGGKFEAKDFSIPTK